MAFIEIDYYGTVGEQEVLTAANIIGAPIIVISELCVKGGMEWDIWDYVLRSWYNHQYIVS